MKFSYNWLRDLVAGTLDLPPKELGRLITMKTAECEGTGEVGAHLARVCAARVIAVEPVGKGHNRRATVDTGRYGVKSVVCGAPNCRAGMVSAYVPPGTVLGGYEIATAMIEGVTSEGMLASGAELGINRDAEGILEFDAEPGSPIPGCAPDFIIEIENKSLTHRPDLWGHAGMAREVAAVTGRKLADPVDLTLIPVGVGAIGVEIEDFDLCPRYSALVFENVTVKPSPPWLEYRLEAIGLNPINNIVDVTNFIMAEIAQPMHAFDADKLRGQTIFIRPARAGERIQALNGEWYDLDPSNLVIADAGGAVAIAGVIGGMDSAITESTTRIVLESANFQAAGIRRTSTRLKLRTDASMRFEKAQDPVNTVRGLARAVELFAQVSPGICVVGGLSDSARLAAPPPPISLPLDWLEHKLGRSVEKAEVRSILERLEFGVEEEQTGTLLVSVPSWRATKDVSIKDDLVEEVGRMVGYDTIVPVMPEFKSSPTPLSEEQLFRRRLRRLAAARGFTEVYNYSFVSEEQVREFGWNPEEHVRVANPISSEQGLMRRNLLAGILKNCRENCRHFDEFRIFEIGYEIHTQPDGSLQDQLPDEIPHLAAAVYAKGDGEAGLMELKGLAQCVAPGCEVWPTAARPFEHPARSGELRHGQTVIGRLFEFHPRMVEGRAAVLDIDLREALRLQPAAGRFQPVRRYPTSEFDLSVVTGLREPAGAVEQRLKSLAGTDLVALEFVRQYSGPPLADGSKSLTFRLRVGSGDRTLSSEEVGAIRERIIRGLESQGYELRI